MALSEEIVAACAGKLDEAERNRTQIGQFSLAYPDMTIDDGYMIQRAWVKRKLAAGRRIIGHKIGLTSRAMQRSSNVNEPDFGALLDDMLFHSGDDIPASRFIEPRVEVELAFILKRGLSGPNCTIDDVLDATDYITPAIEIIDARIERIDKQSGVTRKVFDTIADNAANAGIVLGETRIAPRSLDLRWVSALLYKNDVIEDSGVAAAVLDDPVRGPAWLANKLAPHGEALEAGEIILGGSFTAPLFASAGDRFRIDYGPLGAVTMRFV
jgi:2-oxo-hept-3-ene-1,7-dioate hydratase